MNISYNWLKELTSLDWTPEQMGDRLTLCGTACEYIVATDRYMNNVVVGHVLALDKIEGADKIRKATLDVGSEKLELVCGAPNIAVGNKVPVALVGAEMAEGLKIKKAKIRGVESRGMVCSERELGISADHAGIMVLDSEAKVGQPLADHLDFHDYIMTFDLTPNRPDSMSAIGIARDLAALGSALVTKPAIALKEVAEKASDVIKIKIDDPVGCPRYAARVIKNIKVAPSPWWLQKKLITAGIRPISNVVDITNLVMIETGHPLHAFDLGRFGSDVVVVRKAKEKEKFKTLDGTEHVLTPDVLLITNGKAAVAAGGVMGGLESEVEDDTTDVLLEAAYFNPSVIRKSRKQLGMVSESSSRFEKGADPNGIEYAINRAAALLHDICGGDVLTGIVDCYPSKIDPKEISFRPDRCNQLLGSEIKTERMSKIFTELEFSVSGSDPLIVTVPTFRPDIDREVDLIEEVARIVGYDNIPHADANKGPLYTPYHPIDRFEDQARQLLISAGFDEIVTHGLADSKLAALFEPDKKLVEILNPVSEELDVMRNSVIQSALSIISHNIAHRNLNLRLFELGRCYYPPDKSGNWIEEDRIMLAVTGSTEDGWREKPRELDFYDLKAAIMKLAERFKLKSITFVSSKVCFLDSSVSFEIMTDNKVIGRIGQVERKVLQRFGIKQPVFVADMISECLLNQSSSKPTYEPLPVYPSAPRDLSIVVEKHINSGDIIEQVKKTAGPLARSVNIFDLYTGKQIDSDHKSIAFSIDYRSPQRNLEGDEVDKLQQAVVAMLKKKFKAEVRDK